MLLEAGTAEQQWFYACLPIPNHIALFWWPVKFSITSDCANSWLADCLQILPGVTPHQDCPVRTFTLNISCIPWPRKASAYVLI